MGWGGIVNDGMPEYNEDTDRAFHCFRFMGHTYRPELLPMYDEIYGIPNLEKMIELLLTIVDPESVRCQLRAADGT